MQKKIRRAARARDTRSITERMLDDVLDFDIQPWIGQ
jgi:hypothetical protein